MRLKGIKDQYASSAVCTSLNWHKQVWASLHWLPVRFRIHFKMISFAFKALNGLTPPHLSELLLPFTPSWSLLTVAKPELRGDQDIRQASSLWHFKTHLFGFNSCTGLIFVYTLLYYLIFYCVSFVSIVLFIYCVYVVEHFGLDHHHLHLHHHYWVVVSEPLVSISLYDLMMSKRHDGRRP